MQKALNFNKLRDSIERQLSSKGISVRDLERRSGLKYSVIQNILHGRSKNPTIKVIQSIAQELNCTIDELLNAYEDDKDKNFKLFNKSEQSNSKKSHWDVTLYINSIDIASKIFEQRQISPTKEEALLCIEEIYNYSIGKSDKVDPRFGEWIIERFFDKKLDQ